MVLALCASLSACGSSSPPSPKASRASLVAAALAQKSVHYKEDDEFYADGSQSVTADVTADSGTARLQASYTGFYGTIDMRLVDSTVYVRGDAPAVEDTLDLTSALPAGYAWRWISVPRADNRFSRGALSFLTLASIVKNVPRDVKLVTVADKLPTAFEQTTGSQGDSTTTDAAFSRWNEPVHVRAPANSIPLSTVLHGS